MGSEGTYAVVRFRMLRAGGGGDELAESFRMGTVAASAVEA